MDTQVQDGVMAVTCLLTILQMSAVGGEYKVFCEDVTVDISCQTAEVIVINWAHYGRRDSTTCGASRVTDCTDKETLRIVNERCSGKQRCTFKVDGGHYWGVFSKPCTYVTRYLEMDYKCIRKNQIVSICDANGVNLTTAKGYLANPRYPEKPGRAYVCTTNLTSSGQHLYNITVHDFRFDQCRLTLTSGNITKKYCDNIPVTPRSGRTFISKNNVTTVTFDASLKAWFLLQYSEIKCLESDINLPDNMEVKYIQDNDYAVLDCKDGYVADPPGKVRLDCYDNQWQGSSGQCQEITSTTQTYSTTKPRKPQRSIQKSAISTELAVGIGVCAGILLLLGIVAGVALYLKRRDDSKNMNHSLRNRSTTSDSQSENFYMQNNNIRQSDHNEGSRHYDTVADDAPNTNNAWARRHDTVEDSYDTIRESTIEPTAGNQYDYAWVNRTGNNVMTTADEETDLNSPHALETQDNSQSASSRLNFEDPNIQRMIRKQSEGSTEIIDNNFYEAGSEYQVMQPPSSQFKEDKDLV